MKNGMVPNYLQDEMLFISDATATERYVTQTISGCRVIRRRARKT
jgi:hypothetical protein